MSAPVAVVDVGSNSLHLHIARLSEGGLDTLAVGRAAVRLGILQDGRLRDEAVAGALGALAEFRDQARSHGCVAFEAAATAAVREALDASRLIDGAGALGIQLRVLSGREEALATWEGARRGLGFDEALVFDLGGRSTELVVGRGGRVEFVESLPIGHLRAALLSADDIVGRVQSCLEPLQVPSVPRVVGCAGTALTLARMAAVARGEQPANRHGLRISVDELRGLVRRLDEPNPEAIPGIDERRIASLSGGATAILALLQGLGLAGYTSSESALREGLLHDLLADPERRPC